MMFNEVLLQRRKRLGLSQEALAEQLSVSRQAVSKWETGEASPDLNKLLALSKALDISLDMLCGLQKELPSAEAVLPPPKHRFSPAAILLAIVLLIAVFAGGYVLGHFNAPEPVVIETLAELPENISVTGLGFSPETDGVTYQFTPSFISSDCTYQITFAATGEEPKVYDTTPAGGVCSGRAILDPWNNYTATVTVSNGETTRAVSVAYDLSYSPSANGENGVWLGGRVSWHPVD